LYEWTTREADILLDDPTDLALGNLGGPPDDDALEGGKDASGSTGRTSW